MITTIADRAGQSAAPAPLPAQRTGLTEDQLDELARGYGSEATVRTLAAGQLSLTRSLLAAVRDRAADRADPTAWQLLTELDAHAPQALDAVLAHPYVRAWAVRCLRGEPGADLGGFAELAAAGAVRAGWEQQLAVPVRAGAVHLPTLGRLVVGGAGHALVTGGADAFAVRTADGTTLRIGRGQDGKQQDGKQQDGDRQWQPVRRVALAGGWTVALEDTDPQRDRHQWPVAERLPQAELLDWTGALREAWELLGRDLPGFATGIRAGLTTIAPLRPGPAGRDVSAAARQAFGAVGIARPATAPGLALLIAHEFQHVKLGAVLDHHDLYDRADTGRYYAPWRPDPRPLEGLLQGTYAHLAVTEFLGTRVRAFDGLPGERADRARTQFALWRAHTAEAIATLTDSGALTPLGLRFTAGLRESLTPWLAEPVDPRAEAAAREEKARALTEWRTRETTAG